MSEILYSVKDLAAMTAPSKDPETVTKVIRQIRHWTNNDVVRPFGPKNTGTGVSRVYDEHGARKVALLVELSRYGISVEMLEGFDEWCDEVVHSGDWQRAIEGSGPFYIGVTWRLEDGGHARWRVFDDLEFAAMDTGDDDFVRDDPDFLNFSSLILINMTAVFARLSD
jgi:hypothetical protein